MGKIVEIGTPRLRLRAWREADRPAWLAMMDDPEVSRWLGGPFVRAENEASFDRFKTALEGRGWDLWACERKGDGAVIGAVGVRPVFPDHPLAGSIEVGWRLRRPFWGAGYASEGAAAAISWAFDHLEVDEVVAFTSQANLRSQGVMERIGMVRDPRRDFLHPNLAEGNPLRAHVVYAARRGEADQSS
ncbi:MAG: GNAT family N-acetyltransferase [Caulobacteraceae bacterium]